MEVTGFIYVLRSYSVLGNGLFYPHGALFQMFSSGSLGFSLGLASLTLLLLRLLRGSGPGLFHVLVLVLVLVLVTVRCSPVRIRMAPRFARRTVRIVLYCIVSYVSVSVSVSVFVFVFVFVWLLASLVAPGIFESILLRLYIDNIIYN